MNKLKWTKKLRDCEIVIRDRKEKENRKIVSGKNLIELKRSYLMYKNENGEEIFIPLHRVSEILYKGKTIWKKRQIIFRK